MLQQNKLSQPPRVAQIHLRSDYVEILCLLHPDNHISKDDVLTFYRNLRDTDVDTDVDEDTNLTDVENAEKSDIWDKKAYEWFEHLRFRCNALQELYPFIISENLREIKLQSTLTEQHKTYIFLLLASHLTYFDDFSERKLTSSFEYLSALVLQSHFSSPNAQVHIFGTTPLNIGGRFALGNRLSKMELLASDLCEKIILSEDEKAKYRTGGDGGIDLVAWFPQDDTVGGMLIIFGQCACTLNWIQKQSDSDIKTWKKRMSFEAPPMNAMFIPYFFRDSEGKWFDRTEIRDNILFDRLRFVKLLAKSSIPSDKLPFDIVDFVIEYKAFHF